MALFNLKRRRSREPTAAAPDASSRVEMLTTWGESYYAWNGRLYESDIVRACIRPKVKAVGKLMAKHIRNDPRNGIMTNPDARIRMMLESPNEYMTGQQFQEKMATQLCLNNNAFALIVRDENGVPMQLYPIPCTGAEAIYDENGKTFIRFTYRNGKLQTFEYSDLIHLRQDYNEQDIFGSNPAPALSQLMECVGVIDQGLVKAIKNSGIIRWLLKFNSGMRQEDVKRNVKEFVDNYLSVESDTFGAAGVDAKIDAKQIEPKDYVPNATQSDRITERIYSFFNTNKKIVQSAWSEDEWNAYYEAEIEPLAIQLSDTYTQRLFTLRERGFGNKIIFEASNLACASLSSKLAFQAMVDRGAMTPNEWRATMNLAPIDGGDTIIRRLDTQAVNLVETMLKNMNAKNYKTIAALIETTLKGGESGED